MPSNEEASSRIGKLVAKTDARRRAKALRSVEIDDVLTSETKSAVTSLGLGAEKVKATNGANKFVNLYHAYDGRVVPVPEYMLERRLSDVFEEGMDVPEEFIGERVWYGDPQPTIRPEPTFRCRLSVWGDDETKAEMSTAGLAPMCRKKGLFATQFEADEHFRIKHRRRWEAWQRYLNGPETKADSSSDLIKMLAQELANLRASNPA